MVSDCQVFFLVRGLFHLKVKIDLQHKKNSLNTLTYSYKILNVRYQENERSKMGLISAFIPHHHAIKDDEQNPIRKRRCFPGVESKTMMNKNALHIWRYLRGWIARCSFSRHNTSRPSQRSVVSRRKRRIRYIK